MKFLITGIGKGSYGNGNTLLKEDNLLEVERKSVGDKVIKIDPVNLPANYTKKDVRTYLLDNALITKEGFETIIISIEKPTIPAWVENSVSNYSTRTKAETGIIENEQELKNWLKS